MTRKNTPQRPATLIPFDPVATLNEFQCLLNHVESLARPFEPFARKWRATVRYATVPPAELRRMLSAMPNVEVEIDLFHPDLTARLVKSADGSETISFSPDVEAVTRYRLGTWKSNPDFAKDCVAWEIKKWNEQLSQDTTLPPQFDRRPLLLLQTVRAFLEEIRDDGWNEELESRELSWHGAYQYAERLAVRLNRGNVQYLDAYPFAMDALNLLWEEIQKVVQDFKLTRPVMPRWLTSRSGNPPESATLIRKLFNRDYHNDLNLIRDARSGFVTQDLRIVETGIPLLLPASDRIGSPDELLWKLHRDSLPTSCVFTRHESAPDDRTEPKDLDADKPVCAKCKQCGFVFSSRFIEWGELHRVFRKCGSKAPKTSPLPDGLDHVERCIWRHLQEPQEGNFIPVRQIAESARCSQQTVWRKLKTLGSKVPDFAGRIDSKRGHGGGLGLKETDDPKTC